MAIIAGDKREEHLALTAGGKYPPEKILMIGDAPGDMKAAKANDAMFFTVMQDTQGTGLQLNPPYADTP